MQSTPSEDDVKTFEMTSRDLGYYINLVNRETSGLERKDSHLKEVLLWVKYYQTASFVHERKNQLVCHFLCPGKQQEQKST